MARFQPFAGFRYAVSAQDVAPLTSPPYDVFTEAERATLAERSPRNVVHIDYPVESDGDARYEAAAALWRTWLEDGTVAPDRRPSFYLYRMEFTDEQGRQRRTVGVIGALEVADEGSADVLPHEQTTPKAKSDRLDLLRATRVNLSPVWGLVLGSGLSDLLAEPGRVVADIRDEQGVRHVLEVVDDPGRTAAIAENVASAPVLIADGHHRYAVSRTYRDEQPQGDAASGSTMTYLAELTPEQTSIEAIHRVISETTIDEVLRALALCYDLEPCPRPSRETLADMERDGTLRLIAADGRSWSLTERDGILDGLPQLDSARLAFALDATGCELSYQHGIDEALARCEAPAVAVVLIRPVSIEAIRSVGERHALMPPKSTFFTPKLRTGLVFRDLDRS